MTAFLAEWGVAHRNDESSRQRTRHYGRYGLIRFPARQAEPAGSSRPFGLHAGGCHGITAGSAIDEVNVVALQRGGHHAGHQS